MSDSLRVWDKEGYQVLQGIQHLTRYRIAVDVLIVGGTVFDVEFN